MPVPEHTWQSQFPQLASSRDPVVAEALARARFERFPRGAIVFRPGNPCTDYLLVATGCVRVELVGTSGREVVSRCLARFADRGWTCTSRSRIRLRDRGALEDCARA